MVKCEIISSIKAHGTIFSLAHAAFRRSVIPVCAQNLDMRLFWISEASFGIFSEKVFLAGLRCYSFDFCREILEFYDFAGEFCVFWRRVELKILSCRRVKLRA